MVYTHGNILTVTGYSAIELVPMTRAIDLLDKFWKTLELQNTVEGPVEALVHAIQQGTAVAMSNGSFKDKLGAVAWIIKGNMVEHQLIGVGWMLGDSDNQSAYCGKLFGLWGILASLKCLSNDHKILSDMVEVACDGLSALKKASSSGPTNPRESHHDLTSLVPFGCFDGSYH